MPPLVIYKYYTLIIIQYIWNESKSSQMFKQRKFNFDLFINTISSKLSLIKLARLLNNNNWISIILHLIFFLGSLLCYKHCLQSNFIWITRTKMFFCSFIFLMMWIIFCFFFIVYKIYLSCTYMKWKIWIRSIWKCEWLLNR